MRNKRGTRAYNVIKSFKRRGEIRERKRKNISLKDNRTRVMDISTSKIIRFSKAFYCCCCLAPSSSCCFLSSNIPLVVVLIQQTSVFSELSVACKSSIWHCRTMTVITDPTHGRVLFRTNRYEWNKPPHFKINRYIFLHNILRVVYAIINLVLWIEWSDLIYFLF